MLNILINGSNGTMGKILNNFLKIQKDVNILYEIDKNTTTNFDSLKNSIITPDIIIDFSIPEASFIALDYAQEKLIPIVIATTGFTDCENLKILEYSKTIPIFKSSNMSYSIHVLSNILKNLSEHFNNYDIEILDKHHNSKKDSPSGTSLLFAEAINSSFDNSRIFNLNRFQQKNIRNKNEIGFSSIRGGNIIGEHSVFFIDDNESIELKHTSYSRETYAKGAFIAAKFLLNQKNGLFSMNDLIL